MHIYKIFGVTRKIGELYLNVKESWKGNFSARLDLHDVTFLYVYMKIIRIESLSSYNS